MKRFLSPILACVSLVLLQSGCSTDHGAYLPKNTLGSNQETAARFVLLDPAMQDAVTCSGLQEGFTSDGRLQVAANVRNRQNRRLEVQINCAFKDAQGFALEETPFTTLILTENETQTVTFQALNDKAKAYTVRVRQPR